MSGAWIDASTRRRDRPCQRRPSPIHANTARRWTSRRCRPRSRPERTLCVTDSRITIPSRTSCPATSCCCRPAASCPADGVILEATDFFVSEAVLTGESFPVGRRPAPFDADAALAERTNCVFLGTNVRSGTARCLVVRTGRRTEFGAIAQRLTLRPPETEFDRGIRHFGYLLTSAMLIMVLLVFVAHMLAGGRRSRRCSSRSRWPSD